MLWLPVEKQEMYARGMLVLWPPVVRHTHTLRAQGTFVNIFAGLQSCHYSDRGRNILPG